MDGTLTVAVHDFDAIREALGLPSGEPILEALSRLPTGDALELTQRLDEHEFDLAKKATRQADVWELLAFLRKRGTRLGIVTRNSERVARETLRVCGLREFFDNDDIVGRESARPKPEPDGVLQLLRRWGVSGDRAVVVGDYVFDLQAGRAAGARTIYLDTSREFPWADQADTMVGDFATLRCLVIEACGPGAGAGPA